MRRVLARSDRCIGCRSCEIACARAHADVLGDGDARSRPESASRIKIQSGVLSRDRQVSDAGSVESRQKAQVGPRYVVLCQHCDEPECVSACIAGALTKDADGVVRHHPNLCVGCWMCLMACPFEALSRDPRGMCIVKCDLCDGMDGPSCVKACKVDALYLEERGSGGE